MDVNALGTSVERSKLKLRVRPQNRTELGITKTS